MVLSAFARNPIREPAVLMCDFIAAICDFDSCQNGGLRPVRGFAHNP